MDNTNNSNIALFVQVSPQFNGITATNGRHRQARRRHRSIGNSNQTGMNLNKENSNVDRCKTRCRSGTGKKFPTLAFVGDLPKTKKITRGLKSTGVDGLSEQLGEKNTSLCKEEVKYKRKCKNRCVSSNGAGGEEDEGCVETVKGTHSSARECCPGFCDEDAELSNLQSPMLSVLSVEKKISKGVSRPLTRSLSASKTSQAQDQRHVSSSEIHMNRRKSYSSDILLSPLEPTNMTRSDRPCTHFSVVQKEPLPLATVLFANINSLSEDVCFNDSGSSCHKSGLVSQDGSVYPTCDKPVLSSRKTSQWSAASGKGTPAERRNNQESPQSSCGKPTPRRSKRLQDRYREALRYLQPVTPTAKNSNPERYVSILVTDTPENEYHLTFRQRQQLKVTNGQV